MLHEWIWRGNPLSADECEKLSEELIILLETKIERNKLETEIPCNTLAKVFSNVIQSFHTMELAKAGFLLLDSFL